MAEEVKFTKEELNNIGNFQGKLTDVENQPIIQDLNLRINQIHEKIDIKKK